MLVFFLSDSRLYFCTTKHNTFSLSLSFLQNPMLHQLFCKHCKKLNLLCCFANNYKTHHLWTHPLTPSLSLHCTNANYFHYTHISKYMPIHHHACAWIYAQKKKTLFQIQGHALTTQQIFFSFFYTKRYSSKGVCKFNYLLKPFLLLLLFLLFFNIQGIALTTTLCLHLIFVIFLTYTPLIYSILKIF